MRCRVSVAEVSPYPVVGPKRVGHELSVLFSAPATNGISLSGPYLGTHLQLYFRLGAQAGLSRFGPESD
jgi:hypothetical protein